MQTTAFRISIPEPAIADLRERLARTRWPDRLEDTGWDTGTELSYLKRLADYWRDGFDWRAQEARLNGFAHFTADIDAHRIHFIHERARGGRGIPLILTHGWPGAHRPGKP
jgi:epoxide hydrolase